MKTGPVHLDDWSGVFPVPPLARRRDGSRSLDWTENDKLLRHMVEGGLTRFLYGGNAFLYHVSLEEYRGLLDWLSSFADQLWPIPSAGPSFGRLMDQAPLLRGYGFPAVMHLPCGDPRDAAGLEQGLEEFVQRSATPLILYLKDEGNFGPDREGGLDAVARLVDKRLCVGIKYAVVRPDPAVDAYLDSLLKRVDRRIVLSGIGERPAIVHMTQFGLPGYTTGSGCIGASPTQRMFELLVSGQVDAATALRQRFLPLEDIRDSLGPARVLHSATTVSGICDCGPVPPFVSELSRQQVASLSSALEPLRSSVGSAA
jgi:dihydrodipicolinate synthase/N-acetylneuraminate lyase